jgi:hypothetical protein
MTDSPGMIRQIAWREIFPWLILFRVFRIAISPALLALATLAVLVSPVGWWLAGRLFLTPAQLSAQPGASILVGGLPPAVLTWFPGGVNNVLLRTYSELTEPLGRLFRLEITLAEAAYYTLGFLWVIAVWAFPGGVITRRAIVQLATDEPLGIRPAIDYACRKYLWYVLAPLYPLLGVAALAVPIAALGFALWLLPGLGAVLAGLAWPLVIVAGVAGMWLVGGIVFGWPLMWPTISAERDGDPFEAFSRSYAYVYGKPLQYFFYVAVAAVFGMLCFAVAWGAAAIVREFGFWALSWGAGGPAAAELRDYALDVAAGEFRETDFGGTWRIGATLVGLAIGLIEAVLVAFRFSFFFCTASAIYLLLRHDVDEKEMDEVFVESPVSVSKDVKTDAENQ